MGLDLSVVLHNLQSGVGKLRVILTAPGALTSTERLDAAKHTKTASAAFTNLCGLLHRADHHTHEEVGHADA